MAQFDERKLDEQLFVACLTVVEVGAVEQVEGGVYELYGTFLRHLRHFVAHTVVGFKKCPGGATMRSRRYWARPLTKNCESKPLSRTSL